jgi:CDP-diacylglycerol pyrophosphatase
MNRNKTDKARYLVLAAGIALISCSQMSVTSLQAQAIQSSHFCAAVPDPGRCPREHRDLDNRLWKVAEACKTDLAHGDEGLCREYVNKNAEPNLGTEKEYSIVKDYDARKPYGFLLIPLGCVTGIEDAKITRPDIVDLWQDAWDWSRKYPGRAGSWTGLAINSQCGRSRDQMHIHISCVNSDIRTSLNRNIPIYPWTGSVREPADNLPFGYRAVRVKGLSGQNSPFNVIKKLVGEKKDLADYTIAVIGSQNADEFYILFKDSLHASAEHDLLDQHCADPAK